MADTRDPGPSSWRRARLRRSVRRLVLSRRRPLAAVCAAAGDVPAGSDLAAVGRTLAAPMRAGEPVTDVRLVSPSLMAGYPDRIAVPVRIADADAVGLLRAGDHVDLLAADPRGGRASYVAVDVPIVSLPASTEPDGASGGLTGRLVVVAVSRSDVDRIAGAAATDLLSVVISG